MAETLRVSLNASNPSTVADLLRYLGLGDLVRQSMNQQIRGKAPAASTSQLATLQQAGLDVNARGAVLMRAYSRAGANAGELTVVAAGTTPATAQVALAPNGDVVVLAADAHTVLDIDYSPMKGDYLALTGLNVASNKALLPTAVTNQGVLMLISATATTGTNVGSFVVLVAGSGAPASKQARLDLTKSNIVFAAADAVTVASAELLLCSAKDVDGLLRGQSIAI